MIYHQVVDEVNRAKAGLKRSAKSILATLLYRHPPIGLKPERLQFWLSTLINTIPIDGAIVEIGCSVGGTAAFSFRMLSNLACAKRYVCVDTFGGFVSSQFEKDLTLGNRSSNRWMFSDNSYALTRKIVDQLGARPVELIQGDIVTLPEASLPQRISAALLDVDLAEPIYEGLKKLYPRLVAGGTIVVDDCPEAVNYDWQARKGYERFCHEFKLVKRYEFGMGVVHRPTLPPDTF